MTAATVRLRSLPSPPSRTVSLLAYGSAAYPLVLLFCLYGEWLLSWAVLGHMPRPDLDDPNSIDGAKYLYVVTAIAFMGFLPAVAGAILLNLWYGIDRGLGAARILGRFFGVVGLFAATFALLRWDPGRVACWWFD